MPTLQELMAAQLRIDQNDASGLASGALGTNGCIATNHVQGDKIRTVIQLSALTLALLDNAGVGASTSKQILDFPEGQIRIDSIVADLVCTKSSAGVNATFNGDFSLGTVAANNSATLTGTEADVLASTATPAAVAGVTTAAGINATPAIFDGHAVAKDLYLNALVDDADQDVTTTPCNLSYTGTVTIVWENLGG